MAGLDYRALLNTLIIIPASDTGLGLVASARSCRVAGAMNSSPFTMFRTHPLLTL